jgi:hypothetical protein
MHNKGGAPVAFVEYADVRFAAQALMALQGTYLLSSDRGGVRIEYARNKMAEAGNSPTSGQGPTDKLIHAAAAEMEAKMSQSNNHLAAAAAANSALSQAVQGAPLHALGLYGHHIWLGTSTHWPICSFSYPRQLASQGRADGTRRSQTGRGANSSILDPGSSLAPQFWVRFPRGDAGWRF